MGTYQLVDGLLSFNLTWNSVRLIVKSTFYSLVLLVGQFLGNRFLKLLLLVLGIVVFWLGLSKLFQCTDIRLNIWELECGGNLFWDMSDATGYCRFDNPCDT